jgi:hypothetical protein
MKISVEVKMGKLIATGMLDVLAKQALGEVGEKLVESVNRGFQEERAPDGSKWTPNSPVTIAKKGHKRVLFHLGHLSGSIQVVAQTDRYVKVGPATPEEQRKAILHQFLGVMSKAAPGNPIKRPMLGISEYRGDLENAKNIIERVFSEGMK